MSNATKKQAATTSNLYYEIYGTLDGEPEVLFGSFDRSDCEYELEAERESWKDEGYTNIGLSWYTTDSEPDVEVYGADFEADQCEVN